MSVRIATGAVGVPESEGRVCRCRNIVVSTDTLLEGGRRVIPLGGVDRRHVGSGLRNRRFIRAGR